MRQLRRLPRAVMSLLALASLVAAVTVATTASPAAAQSQPQCTAWTTSLIGAEGSCVNGDPSIRYRVLVDCYWNITDQFPAYVWGSPSRPTTERITTSCGHGGWALRAYAIVDLPPPPPPPSASLICESGANRFFCELQHNVPGSVQITWTVNGGPVASWNGRTYVSGGCGASTTIGVTVSNGTVSATRSWRNCRSGPWL